jgi:hypothetical protein
LLRLPFSLSHRHARSVATALKIVDVKQPISATFTTGC